MTTNGIVFIDTETTSLRHDRRAWEIALIVRDEHGKDTEHGWFVEMDDLDLGNADLHSLNIGRFFERHPGAAAGNNRWLGEPENWVMRQVEALTRGATLVGAVPNFDADVLGNRMRANGICPSWHYHLIDVETLAAGYCQLPPPWGFDDILAGFGLHYDEADRHTALGDARMARDLYDTVMARPAIRAHNDTEADLNRDPAPLTNRCAYCGGDIALVGGTWYHDIPGSYDNQPDHDATPANLAAPA